MIRKLKYLHQILFSVDSIILGLFSMILFFSSFTEPKFQERSQAIWMVENKERIALAFWVTFALLVGYLFIFAASFYRQEKMILMIGGFATFLLVWFTFIWIYLGNEFTTSFFGHYLFCAFINAALIIITAVLHMKKT